MAEATREVYTLNLEGAPRSRMRPILRLLTTPPAQSADASPAHAGAPASPAARSSWPRVDEVDRADQEQRRTDARRCGGAFMRSSQRR
jgi:hypothetical protein